MQQFLDGYSGFMVWVKREKNAERKNIHKQIDPLYIVNKKQVAVT